MIKDLVKAKDLSDKELMYIVSSEWIDEICAHVVANAEEFMKDEFCRNVVSQAAEHILRYQEKHKKAILNGSGLDDFWLKSEESDVLAYKTVLYDCYFNKFGSNSAHTA